MTIAIAELNNQYLNVIGLIDGSTEFLNDGITPNPAPTYVNNATGTVKVVDGAGNAQVIGAASATVASLSYVSATNGNYRALITNDFNPSSGASYTAVIDITAPGGLVAHWEIPVIVKVRTQ